MEELIQTVELDKIYGGEPNQVHALKKLNVSFGRSECAAIVGRSGSGKSTLLHMLGGIDYPTGGQVIFKGGDIYHLKEEKLAEYRCKHVGYVFQDFKLVPELTVRENILLPCVIGKTKAENDGVEELLEVLGLDVKQQAYPEQLSGGQQQRVAIARALIQKPDLVLCDEPTGNLDYKTGEEVLELLLKTRELYGSTIIIVTHDTKIAQKCDRTIELVDGEMQ